ncbi:MAG: glycosyltransferase [Isosphaera sp.]|nr:glycosyltransferase [Isosphaera sp.]
MHIAHAVLSLDVGGLERIVLSLVRAGRRAGHRVSVVCVERPGKLGPEAEADGAEVVSLDKPPGRLPEYVGRAGAVLARLKPDVIHAHQIGAAWYVGSAARAAGGPPVLHTEHGNEFARAPSRLAALKARLFYRRTARLIDRFCCVSDEIAAAVCRWRTVPRAKVEVVTNGIPTDPRPGLVPPEEVRAQLGIPPGAPVVGTVGRLAEVKRQDLLVRAVGRLRATFPDVHLLLVGDGEERGRLEALAAEVGLSGRAHFAGYQSCPEQYLRIMSAFALTSRSEGFPVSLLEAWLAGAPAVCSAVGGIPRVVTAGEDGLLFPSGDEAALAAALGRLLGDAGLREELAAAGGRAVRERYSLDRMAAGYEGRYRELLARRGGG